MNALELVGLAKSFGALVVINDLHLAVQSGARHAIIGPNGAGKTTLFNLITGWLRPDAGRILVDGADITQLSPGEIPHRGIARSFQRNTLMNGLTVGENLRLAAQALDASRRHMLADRHAYREVIARGNEAARLMQLDDVVDRPVSSLAYGQKRQLEVAMALCSRPRMLLLDEPAAGTSPAERARLIELIKGLPSDVTLLLVEHDMDVVFEVCAQITVLSYGRHLVTGAPDEVRNNPDVRDAYLGKGHA
jgi:branched-chain amino acid transport system ATP-binding protein